MIKELIKLANDLDSKGLTKEANALDEIIKRVIVKESLDASGLGGYGAASRPAPRILRSRSMAKRFGFRTRRA